MATVGTSLGAIILAGVVLFVAGAVVAALLLHPYLCDRKVDPNRPTVCHPSSRHR